MIVLSLQAKTHSGGMWTTETRRRLRRQAAESFRQGMVEILQAGTTLDLASSRETKTEVSVYVVWR